MRRWESVKKNLPRNEGSSFFINYLMAPEGLAGAVVFVLALAK